MFKKFYSLTHTPQSFEIGTVIPNVGKVVELRKVESTKGIDGRIYPCYEIYCEISFRQKVKEFWEKLWTAE